MKKNKTSDFFGSKGFYIALFSAVVLVVAIAAIASINNMNTLNQAENELSKANQSYAVDTDTTNSDSNVTVTAPKTVAPFKSTDTNVDKDIRMAGTTNPTTGIGSNATAGASSNQSGSYAANSSDTAVSAKPVIVEAEIDEELIETSTSTSKPITEAEVTVETVEPDETVTAAQPEPQKTEPVAETEKPVTTAEVITTAEETPESSETFLNFSESSKMMWPVIGEVAMDYSMDRLIYDKTLDHYRTNNGVSIAAPAGSQVKSAASGQVVSVEYDDQSGNKVVIDHGNGWKTTYGQLQNGVLVDVGQTVKEGQVIGGVGTPTRFGILLGDHLEFKVTKNDIPQDPSLVLGGEE